MLARDSSEGASVLWSPVEARWEEARLLREKPPLDCRTAGPCRLRPLSPKLEGAAEEVPGAPRVGINNLLVLIASVSELPPSFTGKETPGGGPVMPRSVLGDLSAIARDWREGLRAFTWGP